MPDMDVELWLAKGNILKAIDNASGATLEAIREALNNGDRVEEVAQQNLDLSNEATQHLKDDWFSPGGWFGFDTSDIIRAGFILAINVANPGLHQAPSRSLDCWWARGDSAEGPVHVAVSERSGSVLVIIRTPKPGRAPAFVGTTLMDEPFSVVVDAQQPPVTPQYREI